MAGPESAAGAYDASRPHSSRVYDYLLGGTANAAADRAVGDRITESLPAVGDGVRAQRAVLGRAVRYLVADAGIRQLIDVGSGLPTADNVHEIAQRADPAARVAYVDNDPVVLAHATALLAGNPGAIVTGGDLRDPAGILGSPELRAHLDLGRPAGLLLCGILHYIPDADDPAGLVAAFRDALPAGSYVFIHHLLDAEDPAVAGLKQAMRQGLGEVRFRTMAEVGDLFAGLELVEPGLVLVPEWRPDPGTPGARDHPVLRLACAGLARKP